jgi:sulfide:quinone oxidoreductase
MERHQVLVVGGGNAGISLAARLLRDGVLDVAVVEGEQVHRYRPLLNYVGTGQVEMRRLERLVSEVVPRGCTWIRDEVVTVDPATSTARTREGRTLEYSTLVVSPGLVEDWEATPGLREAYAEGWATSTFLTTTAPQVWSALRSVSSGAVVFTVPPEPAPCGATALKPLLMACDHWRRTGVLADIDVRLVLPGPSVTGLPAADDRLERLFADYGVTVLRDARISSVDTEDRSLTLTTPAGSEALRGLALAHVVPHYRAPAWVSDSGLADDSPAGLVDVDPETMRHRRHPSVWSLGDVAALGTRPSGGALRHQVEILAGNMRAAADGQEMSRYDGYTVMPITVSRRELMLVEVDREGSPAPSVPVIDLTKPRRFTWWFDRYVLPVIYFRRILRGKV